VLQFQNVNKTYEGGIDALKHLNFSLAKGELAFVTGPSGAGKSTLFRLIALMEQPSRGQIILDGQDVSKLSRHKIPLIRRKLGLIFQDYKLLKNRTVFENVALPLVIAGYPAKEIQSRVCASLELVGLLAKQRRFPLALSGGEQQRVGIARALVHKPQLIIADEPTGNLDSKLAYEIMNLFIRLQQVGISVLIASHDYHMLESMQVRILTLNDGVLVSDSAQQNEAG
jgi:cell division transport system ATP-binding protein